MAKLSDSPLENMESSMNGNWVDEMIATAIPQVVKWRGGRVQMWEYTPTHKKLTLRIESPNIEGNVHLVCGGCVFVRGPFSWDNCNLMLSRATEEGVVLTDEKAEFELRFSVISIDEDVDPIYRPSLGAGA